MRTAAVLYLGLLDRSGGMTSKRELRRAKAERYLELSKRLADALRDEPRAENIDATAARSRQQQDICFPPAD